MTDFLNQTEFENRNQTESNDELDNQLMLVEFALFNKKVEKNMIQAGLGLKLFFGILLMIMETLGNYLLFCMVWYETFGMDSKKRTITNQLLSRMIFALIFFNIFFMPLQFVAAWIPLSKYIGTPPLTRFFGPRKNRVKGKPRYRRSILVLKP